LTLEFLVLADIGRDHLPHLPSAEQLAQALIVDACIVGSDGEILHAARLDCIDEALRDAAKTEASGANRHSVEQEAIKRSLRVRINFLHLPLRQGSFAD
jgi:hypothetical protein